MDTSNLNALNAINLLIQEGYVIPNQDKENPSVAITAKLTRLLQEQDIQTAKATTVLSIKRERISLHEFKELAEVPGLIKTKDFSFNANRISVAAEKVFNKLVGAVDMQRLIDATKAYYKNEKISRTTLTNYFTEGIWKSVYDSYSKSDSGIVISNPKFTGERSL